MQTLRKLPTIAPMKKTKMDKIQESIKPPPFSGRYFSPYQYGL
jgi:hypothetical protein